MLWKIRIKKNATSFIGKGRKYWKRERRKREWKRGKGGKESGKRGKIKKRGVEKTKNIKKERRNGEWKR
jgi:hypothetical protein